MSVEALETDPHVMADLGGTLPRDEMTRTDGGCRGIDAFPGTTNSPSNALCDKFGIERREEMDVA